MRVSQPFRFLAAGLAILVMALMVFLVLAASNLAFSVYDRLAQVSPWLALAYGLAVASFATSGGIVVWRLLAPPPPEPVRPRAPPDESKLREDLDRHESAGVAVHEARAEIGELEQRRQSGEVYVAVFGEISHGKSSLIRALVPGAEPEVDVRGGTTQAVQRYSWQGPHGDRLYIADVPGVNFSGEPDQPDAEHEALRAHIVIYVCDGDLTRDQWRTLDRLRPFKKPLIVAINKKDRYTQADLELILTRLRERLGADTPVVAIQSGGREEIIRVGPDGTEERIQRERPPEVGELVTALQTVLMEQGPLLDTLRDSAVFLLAAEKLERALSVHRRRTADEVITRYTRRAVVGGLAAFAPGSDLVIQGALAVALVRALCRLYEVPVRDVAIEGLVKSATARTGQQIPLLLAVAGNALKAFPGTGTLAGGLAHAVAYGLLFQSLGRALADTLAEQGKWDSERAMAAFEEQLSEDLGSRARDLARMALTYARDQLKRPSGT